MRLVFVFLIAALPVSAWEFSASPICTLMEETDQGHMTITHDANLREYTITLTLNQGVWDKAPVFGMAFEGGQAIAIQTDQHQLSANRRSLTVKDSGFGNVLNGFEFNRTAIGATGRTALTMPLEGIGPAILAFRACPADNLF